MKKLLGTCSLVGPLLLGILAGAPAQADNELFLGSVAMDAPEAMVRRMAPLTQYLSVKTGYRVTFHASPNLGSAVYDLGNGFTQIAYLTPVAYIDAREKFHVVPLVAPLRDKAPRFHLAIVVRKDSGIHKIADLRGKKFAFGDEKALLQRAVVVGAGIKLEELGSYAYLKHYDTIAKAVLRGDFDAGILKHALVGDYDDGPQGLRTIYKSPPLPPYLFAVNDKLPADKAEKLRKALLDLKPDTPEHRAILNSLDDTYDGFVRIGDHDYDLVRKLIAPFRNETPRP
jgi:phosphonate transport system substrate-binding protein